ncbi:Hypothetical_protein [Hexamita inflata]|uniref:Hypothetical_protein n=1 Tax=Hexamita inflata TaxID=28002 RepID=A0AA86TL17_9EUKA|nr:Hypothetical protein HINF_LOCUS8265 [Hexamita inflata]
MNNVTTLQLVETIACKFRMEQVSDINNKVSLYTMLLPDQLYQKLFQQLSAELFADASYLRQLFVEQVVSKHFLKNNMPTERTEYNFKQAHMRKKSLNALEVQNQFVAALKKVLAELGHDTCSLVNHRQLCIMANEHLKDKRSTEFWREIRKLIPQKTETQLREYYQKSFLRHMFEESISVQDKIILCDLMNEMPNEKPSKIADAFVKKVGTGKYFHRNIVMYVVNKKEK